MKTAVLALACVFPCLALAAPPAPRITVQATDIKQLGFEWPAVAGATRYELWFKASDAAPWVEYTEKPAPRTSLTVSVAVHLLEWPQARYQLKACNASGCSTSNTVRVNHDEKLVAMGYFKPNNTSAQLYGGVVALSADGKTLAVLTSETVGAVEGAAVVYVYRSTSSAWRYEAKLRASTPEYGTAGIYLGDPIALSADGNVLALGVAFEGLPGTERYSAGAVYLFRRSGSTWGLSQRLTGNERFFDEFGYAVKLDDAGRTLAVTHDYPSASAADADGGILEIYRDAANDGSDQFVHETTLPVPFVDGVKARCRHIALSGDGQTLLRSCFADTGYGVPFVQVLKAPGWSSSLLDGGAAGLDISYDGRVFLAQQEQSARVWRLTSTGWVADGGLGTFGGRLPSGHRGVALSRDGRFAAIGSVTDVAAGLGPIFTPYSTGDAETGAVIVHERRSTGWVIRRLVKPGSTQTQFAGHSVALGDNGRTMAVGAIYEDSGAMGINGDREDESAPDRGAVWLY